MKRGSTKPRFYYIEIISSHTIAFFNNLYYNIL